MFKTFFWMFSWTFIFWTFFLNTFFENFLEHTWNFTLKIFRHNIVFFPEHFAYNITKKMLLDIKKKFWTFFEYIWKFLKYFFWNIYFKNIYFLSRLTRYILIDPIFVSLSFFMRFYLFFSTGRLTIKRYCQCASEMRIATHRGCIQNTGEEHI